MGPKQDNGQRCIVEQVTKHLEGRFNGQETTSTHGSLQVPGCAGSPCRQQEIRQLSSEHEIHAKLIRACKRQLLEDGHRGYASNGVLRPDRP